MTARTYLGFDYGAARIGVAVGQDLTGTANAVTVLSARGGDIDWPAITAAIDTWQPAALVVGVPDPEDQRPHALRARALRFARQLAGRFRLPVHTIDEHLSSHVGAQQAAPRTVRRHGGDDGYAAAVILSTWLAETRIKPGPAPGIAPLPSP